MYIINMSCFDNIYNISFIKKVSMLLLALLPMLAWYAIPFPLGLGYALVLFLSVYTIARNSFKINVFPVSFWIVFAYVSIMWMYHYNFAMFTLLPPGGWVFFIFFLALVWGVINFDHQYLEKYMRWVVLISAALFWIQFAQRVMTGSYLCFVPNLTGAFTYEGMSYAEVVAFQSYGTRPCSIFLEPSYMAHYYITYLAIVWFDSDNQKKWINKEIILIILSIIALKSGSGMVGLAIILIVKIFTLYWNANAKRRFMLIMLIIPIVAISVNTYIDSEIGQDILSRSKELSTDGTSGFTRVVSGYMMFDQLKANEQMFGISDFRDKFGILQNDGTLRFFANGVQTILLSLGYIGALFYLFFYTSLFRKSNLASRMCIIILLVMSLLESNYLNPYMMLLTIIPCANYYKHNNI